MKYILLFVGLFLLLSINSISAQASNDTLVAWQYYQKADSLLTIEKHDASIESFKKALIIYEEEKIWEQVASCYNKISNILWRDSKLDNSIKYAQNALEICKTHLSENSFEEALAYDNLGLCYEENLEYEKALTLFKKSLSIKQKILPQDHKSLGASYQYLGVIAEDHDNLEEALFYYKRHLEISLKARGAKHEYTANSYNNIGAVLDALGKHDEALQYHKKSLEIRQELFGEEHYHVSNSYNNIGLVYRKKGDYDSALKYYQKAIGIRQELFGEGHSTLIGPYHNIGVLYDHMELFDDALKFYNKGLSIILNLVGADHIYTAQSYENLADHYLKQGSYNKALDYYIKSQKIYINFLNENDANVAYVRNQIGLTYFKKKEYNNAIKFYDKAIEANSKNNVDRNFNTNSFLNLNTLLISYEGKAKTLSAIFKEKGDITKLNESISIHQRSDTIINYLHQNLSNYNDKIVFAQKAKQLYQGAIEAQLLFHQLEQEQKHLEKAIYYAEKSKASTLKELLNTSVAKDFAKLPKHIVGFEKKIKIDKAFYLSQIAQEQSKKSNIDTAKIKEFENQLFDLNRKQDSLTTVIETNYPKYYNLKYQNKVISVADIQSKLDEQTTLLEFFTSDSATYAFTITKSSIDVQELATPDLANKVNGFNQSITSKDLKAYKKYGYELYQKLVSPIASKIKGNQLIIVPDGPLWHLNFDLLLTRKSDSNNPKELPYLVKEYIISYANSATLLFDAFKEPKREDVVEECLAFSFTDSTSIEQTKTMSLAALRDAGDDLPGTREEIKAISNIIDGQYYFGSQAIETNFKKNANKYNILHLALHGEVDHERPENSRLFFTKSNDTIDDSFLYNHELFALDIPAELTVLSACNTGSGKIAKGEGIMSLGNAFQYAGTKSLLLTSWEVSDQTTPELMKYFYTNLKKGMNKAEALQQAKLAYINTANVNRVDPFYWGGFYLVGDPEPIQFANHSWRYWILGIGFSILLLGLFYFINKKKR